MQGVLGVIRSQPKEWKQQPGRLLEIWDLTLRNPGFSTVSAPSELDRWPSEHRQDWESIWHEIRSLTTDQTDLSPLLGGVFAKIFFRIFGSVT
jgi:hypothetical protein